MTKTSSGTQVFSSTLEGSKKKAFEMLMLALAGTVEELERRSLFARAEDFWEVLGDRMALLSHGADREVVQMVETMLEDLKQAKEAFPAVRAKLGM